MKAAGASFLTWFKICVWDLLWVIRAGASQHLILLSFACCSRCSYFFCFEALVRVLLCGDYFKTFSAILNEKKILVFLLPFIYQAQAQTHTSV